MAKNKSAGGYEVNRPDIQALQFFHAENCAFPDEDMIEVTWMGTYCEHDHKGYCSKCSDWVPLNDQFECSKHGISYIKETESETRSDYSRFLRQCRSCFLTDNVIQDNLTNTLSVE